MKAQQPSREPSVNFVNDEGFGNEKAPDKHENTRMGEVGKNRLDRPQSRDHAKGRAEEGSDGERDSFGDPIDDDPGENRR